jgi:hypothetical protein
VKQRSLTRHRPRTAFVAVPALVAALAAAGLFAPASAAAGGTSSRRVPSVPGYGQVAPSPAGTDNSSPAPLPRKSGTVPVDTSASLTSSGSTTTSTTTSTSSSTKTTLAAPTAAATVAPTSKVGLRALVLAVDEGDFGLPTWKQTLDNVGAAYDVLDTRTTPLTSDTLVRPDGTGRYNAILLTSSSLLYQDPNDPSNYLSGLTADQWNLLWAYERDYKVRQAVLYTSYGAWPEDYCLTGSSEGGVGDAPLNVTLTSAGSTPFSYLKANAQIPIVQSYVYRTRITSGCAASALLTAGSDVLGVQSTSTDGRERTALTFTTNQNLLQAQLLPYGLFRWASRGLFLGEQRHLLNVDVDDWFNTSDLWVDGAVSTTQTYEMSGHDAYNASVQQSALRRKYPLASGFTMGMAYNGDGADLRAGTTCYPDGGVSTLSSTTRCLRNQFRWINHTYSHPKLNFTDYTTNSNEIGKNLTVASKLGLPVDKTVLKTPEYSGLGVYNPDPTNDIDPPTDYGIMASNQALLDAAADRGLKYLHGNMSFKSHQPPCFNCGLVHPMKPSLLVVPDWPTNIAYFSNDPTSETSFYNYFYGPGGKFAYFAENQTYDQVLDNETELALRHLASGSIYTHTFHIANLDDYGNGRTLLTDWADKLIGKYASYYSVPLLSPGWPALAVYASSRTTHFATLPSVDAVYDSSTNKVTVTSSTAGKVQVTGARTSGYTTYGNESSSLVTLAAGTPVTFTASRLP